MSFGGSAQAMITTLKNNEKMRSKRDKFKRILGRNCSNVKPQYDFPEATPEILREIRNKLKKENQVIRIKILCATAVIIISLVWVFFTS